MGLGGLYESKYLLTLTFYYMYYILAETLLNCNSLPIVHDTGTEFSTV